MRRAMISEMPREIKSTIHLHFIRGKREEIMRGFLRDAIRGMRTNYLYREIDEVCDVCFRPLTIKDYDEYHEEMPDILRCFKKEYHGEHLNTVQVPVCKGCKVILELKEHNNPYELPVVSRAIVSPSKYYIVGDEMFITTHYDYERDTMRRIYTGKSETTPRHIAEFYE